MKKKRRHPRVDIIKKKNMKKRLQQLFEFNKEILERSPAGILRLDEKLRIVYENPKMREILGVPPGEQSKALGTDARVLPPLKKAGLADKFNDLLEGKEIAVETPFTSIYEKKFFLKVTGIPFFKKDKFAGAVLLVTDLTEYKKVEEKLRESEERFRDVAANTGEWIWEVDVEGRYTYSSLVVKQVLGYTAEEVLGKFFYDFFHPDEREQLKSAAFEIFKRRESFVRFVNRNIHKDGQTIILETSGVPIIDAKGKFIGYRGTDRDVTESKKMENERRRFEEKLSTLNIHGQSLNVAKNLEEICTLTLDAAEKTLGFEYAAVLIVAKGKLRVVCQHGYPTDLLTELPLDGTKKGITVKAANTCKSVLVSDTSKDENYVEGILGVRSELAVPIEMENEILGILNVESKNLNAFDEKDVTLPQILASHAATAISNLEKRREIEKRSGQLASLMKSSTKMISSTDLRQRLQTIAEAIQELGWRRVVISIRNENMEITNPDDMVTAGLTDEEISFLWNNRPPGQVWLERIGSEYERFKIGEFFYLPWNDPWVRERFADGTVPSRLPPEEMVDWDPQDLLYSPFHLANGRIVGILSIDDPLDGRRPTKESLAPLELFIHQAAVAIENAQLIHSLNIAKEQLKTDAQQLELKVEERTRELKETQKQLLKSQRLAAIGELASMIGHDLRNPLTGITGAAYYLKKKLDSKIDEKSREMLELIERDLEYSNKIINDLLEYSIEMRLELTETTLKHITKEALSLVKLPKNVEVLDTTRDKPKIKVDIEKVKRIFVNLIKNAVEAMPKGGKLTIKTQKTNGNLEIAFADTGIGISKDILEKIWTPLFTTKAKGMGLGLPICKRIVEAHNGNISVKSTVGKGTIFTVTFPITPKLEGGEKIWIQMPGSSLSMTTKA